MANLMKPSLPETETQLTLGPPKCVWQGEDGQTLEESNALLTNERSKKNDEREISWNGLNLSIGLHSHSNSDAGSREEVAESRSPSSSGSLIAMDTTCKNGSKRKLLDLITAGTVSESEIKSDVFGCEMKQSKHNLAPSAYEWNTPASCFPAFQMGMGKACDPAALDPSFPLRQAFLKAGNKEHCGGESILTKLSFLNRASPMQDTEAETTDESAPRGPVGWPPVQSFRKNSLPPPRLKNNAEIDVEPAGLTSPKLHSSQTDSLYVKVYMDGLSIGRKVDLKSYGSYEELSLALNELFTHFNDGQACVKSPCVSDTEIPLNTATKYFSSGFNYALTYEDKDGDLMLVGDVPWGMFMASAKRLRIMKGSEAIGIHKYCIIH